MGKINDEHVKKVCKPGTAECCRYLTMGADGWDCAKTIPSFKAILDERVRVGTIRATGDNCEGK